METGQPIRTFEGYSSWDNMLSLSGDGRRAISGSDNTLFLWDMESDDPIHTFKVNSGVVAVSLSGNGRWAIAGCSDMALVLLDVETGRQIRTFRGHSGGVNSVSLNDDGSRAISGSDDRTLIRWDMEKDDPIHIFKGHSRPVKTVSLSGDGRRAISGSDDKMMILWDAESRKILRRLSVEAGIHSVSMSADKIVFADQADEVQFLQIWG